MRSLPRLTTVVVVAAALMAAAFVRAHAQTSAEIGSLKIAIDLVERG